MAKEKSTDAKKEKKEKKEKRSEKDGVHKSKSSKSEKKSKSAEEAQANDLTTKLLNTLEYTNPGSVVVKENDAIIITAKPAPLLGALVPFANPLADEKVGKKVLKGVKKAAKSHALKRGVKEVVKSLRKSAIATTTSQPHSLVILAADISPMDVISHIPVLCEDHGVPYIFVTSRAELGAAGSTKRPTSVVMVGREKGGKKGEGEEEGEEWGEVYADLVKVVEKAGRGVRV